MKTISIVMILFALACWGAAFPKTPIIKMPTPMAIERIEADFIRSDLTMEERKQLDFYMLQVSTNQAVSYSAFQFAMGSLTLLSVAVIILNIFSIRKNGKMA